MPRFEYHGRQFGIEAFTLPDNRGWGCAIYPDASHHWFVLTEPRATNDEPVRVVAFASADEAVESGRVYVMQDLLRMGLLRRFMQLLKDCEAEHPGVGKILIIPSVMLPDWRALKQSDWDADGWEGEDQDLTSLDRDNETYLQALRRRLDRVGIVDIRVNNSTLYIQVIPSDG